MPHIAYAESARRTFLLIKAEANGVSVPRRAEPVTDQKSESFMDTEETIQKNAYFRRLTEPTSPWK